MSDHVTPTGPGEWLSRTENSLNGQFTCTDSNSAPVNIPLEVQERLFWNEAERHHARIIHLLSDSDDGGFGREVVDLAEQRLHSGFAEYGSEMFTWDAARRRRNVLEELADAIVYMISGPIE